MSFTRWSVAIAWIATFGLVGLAASGVTQVPLPFIVVAALAVPSLVLRNSAAAALR